jgi:hypothetical protein
MPTPPPPDDPDDTKDQDFKKDEQDDSGAAFRLHHDIHIHLPPTSDVAVYRAIFQAMKSELV